MEGKLDRERRFVLSPPRLKNRSKLQTNGLKWCVASCLVDFQSFKSNTYSEFIWMCSCSRGGGGSNGCSSPLLIQLLCCELCDMHGCSPHIQREASGSAASGRGYFGQTGALLSCWNPRQKGQHPGTNFTSAQFITYSNRRNIREIKTSKQKWDPERLVWLVKAGIRHVVDYVHWIPCDFQGSARWVGGWNVPQFSRAWKRFQRDETL